MISKIGIHNAEHYASPTEQQAINNAIEEANRAELVKCDNHAKKFMTTIMHLCGLSDYTLFSMQIKSKRTGKAYSCHYENKQEQKNTATPR